MSDDEQKRRRGGQPTKFSPERAERLIAAIRAGNYLEPACTYAGIDQTSMHNWCNRGKREGEGPYFEFFQAIERAKAEAEMIIVAHWRAHCPTDWRASANMLARRYPERWAPRETDQGEVVVRLVGGRNGGGERKLARTARRTKRDQRE